MKYMKKLYLKMQKIKPQRLKNTNIVWGHCLGVVPQIHKPVYTFPIHCPLVIG
jgi:hypothetical protein